jgi:hypothetical protein
MGVFVAVFMRHIFALNASTQTDETESPSVVQNQKMIFSPN